MKVFKHGKDSTKTQYGKFSPTSALPTTMVKGHMRAMPVRKPKMDSPMPLDLGAPAPDMSGPVAMAKGGLTSAKRDSLPKGDFGLPGSRKYPMPDKSHAANAKARASQMVAKGKLSESAKGEIDAKANKVLHKAKGGQVRSFKEPMIKRGC